MSICKIDAGTIPSSIRSHAIIMCDVVYFCPLYSASKGKSHYAYAHSIYHKQCSMHARSYLFLKKLIGHPNELQRLQMSLVEHI